MIEQYKKSTITSLFTAYKKPSDKKQHAWIQCMRLMHDYNGKDLKIISYYWLAFTAGFTFDNGTKLMVMTRTHNFILPIS